MRFTQRLTLFLAVMTACVTLRADDDCRVPMADWQTRAAVQKMVQLQGWEVYRIKVDDGCYEIRGRDSQGRSIEAKVDPGSLKIIEIEYEDDDDEEH